MTLVVLFLCFMGGPVVHNTTSSSSLHLYEILKKLKPSSHAEHVLTVWWIWTIMLNKIHIIIISTRGVNNIA